MKSMRNWFSRAVAATRVGGVYVAGLIVLHTLDDGGWTFAIAATPLFFLIPLGLGLFLFTLAGDGLANLRLGRSCLIVAGMTIGFALIPSFVGALSRVFTSAAVMFYILMGVAYIGLVRARRYFQIAPPERARVWGVISAVLFICGIHWWLTWGVFSRFPFGDLFAETHKMMGAIVFSESGRVIPPAEHYAPLREILSGGLSAAVGLDILKSHWILGFWASFYLAISMYALLGSVLEEKRRLLALPLLACCLAGVPSNAGFATAAAVGLLSVLIAATKRIQPSIISNSKLAICAAAVCATGVIAISGRTPVASTLIAGMAVAVPIAARVESRGFGVSVAAVGVAALLALASRVLHRGAILANIAAVSVWLLYVVLSSCPLRKTESRAIVVWWLMTILPAACVGFVILVVATKFKLLNVDLDGLFLHIYSPITAFIIGMPINLTDDIGLGFGTTLALIELIRAVDPLTIVIAGISAVIWLYRNKPNILARRSAPAGQWSSVEVVSIWAWLGAMAILLFQLSGFPFAYRIAPIVVSLLYIAIPGFLFNRDGHEVGFQREYYLIAYSAAATALYLSVAFYGILLSPGTPAYGYQVLFWPTLVGLLVACLILLVVITIAPSPWLKRVAFVGFLVLAIIVSRGGMATLFMPYSYGPRPVEVGVISHYSKTDIDVAHWVRRNIPRTLIVSDPYTMAITKALTGSPGLYEFSNLDSVEPTLAREIKQHIALVITAHGSQSQSARSLLCRGQILLLLNLSKGTIVQIFDDRRAVGGRLDTSSRRNQFSHLPLIGAEAGGRKLAVGPLMNDEKWNFPAQKVSWPIAEALRKEGADSWNIIMLLNERTLRWIATEANERVGYFPRDTYLPKGLEKIVQNNEFRIIHNQLNKTMIVDINCFKAAG